LRDFGVLASAARKEVTLIHADPGKIGIDLEPLIERRLLMERLWKPAKDFVRDGVVG